MPWTDGKKTYLLVAAILVEGTLQAFGYHVPFWLEFMTGGGALAAHRQSISNLASVLDDIGSMVLVSNYTVGPNAIVPITPEQKVHQVANTQAYKDAKTEVEQTAMLNNSQIKG